MPSSPLPHDTHHTATPQISATTAVTALFSPSLRQRAGLCSLAHPQLKCVRPITAFHFHSPTLLMILSGSLSMSCQQQVTVLDASSGIVLVDADIFVDLVKYPAASGAPFRSMFITLAESVVARFRQLSPPVDHAPQRHAPWCTLQDIDEIVQVTERLEQIIEDERMSNARLELRLFDLLTLLAERGVRFSAPVRQDTAGRLRQMIQAQPEVRWTASMAGRELAISEATLRRRLASGRMTFDAILREVRLQHGMTLIQTTGWTLTQIADACGYLSAARFSARFKTRFGISPAQIR